MRHRSDDKRATRRCEEQISASRRCGHLSLRNSREILQAVAAGWRPPPGGPYVTSPQGARRPPGRGPRRGRRAEAGPTTGARGGWTGPADHGTPKSPLCRPPHFFRSAGATLAALHSVYVKLRQVRYTGSRLCAVASGRACRTFPQAPAAHRLAFGSSPHCSPKRASSVWGSRSSRSQTRVVHRAPPPTPLVLCATSKGSRGITTRCVAGVGCFTHGVRSFVPARRPKHLARACCAYCCARAVLTTRSFFNAPTL